MPSSFFKKLILILVALGLLSSLQPFATTNFDAKKIEITDSSQGEKHSEEENCELENWNFLNKSTNLEIIKTAANFKQNNQGSFLDHFATVPTSPPKA